MYNNEENNSATPYRASRNLNTSIGNPNIDVNNTMNINIQNVSTNYKDTQTDSSISEERNNNVQVNNVNNDVMKNSILNSKDTIINTEKKKIEEKKSSVNPYIPNVKEKVETINDKSGTKVYTPDSDNNSEEEKKTATSTVRLGSEFRMALLIIVLLLAVLFVLPMFSGIIGG